ncbi:unnamed protein product [Protopolystoma xenopodis]|uniref:Uncharacterized protein n=1 Tax=Protopolystoma xenopodis TaxID=117903 RepID=A0A3S5AK48_9PLAT|nr:unnamed protein product [Protopolystoma xenopodis]
MTSTLSATPVLEDHRLSATTQLAICSSIISSIPASSTVSSIATIQPAPVDISLFSSRSSADRTSDASLYQSIQSNLANTSPIHDQSLMEHEACVLANSPTLLETSVSLTRPAPGLSEVHTASKVSSEQDEVNITQLSTDEETKSHSSLGFRDLEISYPNDASQKLDRVRQAIILPVL